MEVPENKNIEKSTYRGLLFFTMILLIIFVSKSLLLPYKLYSYDESDKKFESGELFPKKETKTNTNDINNTKAAIIQNDSQKNIIKDLTVNQKIVNINRSSVDDLVKLPGIGLKTAEKIVRYRNEHGYFITKDELKNVNGIGTAKLKKIEKLIKLK